MKVDDASSARQYANALLELASGRGSAQQLGENLAGLVDVLKGKPEFQIFLKHPAISSADKHAILKDVFKDTIDDITTNLLELLIERRRTDLLPKIAVDYKELLNERNNIAAGTLTSAEPMDAASVEKIRTKLSERLGKRLDLEVKVDRSLIGGYILKVGDQVIDGSFKGRLSAIEKSLLSV